jgi:hypothetical protein
VLQLLAVGAAEVPAGAVRHPAAGAVHLLVGRVRDRVRGAAGGGHSPVAPPAVLPPAPPMPAPARPGAPAGAGLMPARGPQGPAVATPTTWSAPVTPAGEFGTARTPAAPKPGAAPVVNTGYRAPK